MASAVAPGRGVNNKEFIVDRNGIIITIVGVLAAIALLIYILNH